MSAGTVVLSGAAPLRLDPDLAERLTGGQWLGARTPTAIRGASLDSRRILPGNCFVCIAGANHDGHDHAAAAVGDGAALVIATRRVAVPAPVLLVADAAAALAALAAEQRRRLAATTWIAIAGANGKTTTKELVAAACRGGGARVHATEGNRNNHLGVPLTVLDTPAEARFAVIEVGTNHPGEVAALCAIVQPQVVAVASIGPEHLEGLINLVGVAREESAAIAALPPGGHAVAGVHALARLCRDFGDDLHAVLGELRTAASGRALTLVDDGGMAGAEPADGTLHDDGIELRHGGRGARIPLLGAHNLVNAHVALRTALHAGVPAADALRGLERVRQAAGRLVERRIGAHRILDDSYNANPGSMCAGLAALARIPGRRLAVLGHMGELGAAADAGHRLVGAEAARLGIPVVAVGPKAVLIAAGCRDAGGDAIEAADRDRAAALAHERMHAGPLAVLVKGSRSAGLETVVAALTGKPVAGGHP